MSKVSKQRKEALAKFDKSKSYSLNEAVNIVKQITYSKFDASVDLNIRLGVDPRKANQMVRGSVTLPHGTGKVVRVLVLCNPDKAQEALDAGADYVGLDEYIQKIKDGWTDIDIVITTPNIMPKVGALGRILGPRGLMPNPKTGTVTMDVAKAVQEVKAGKIDFKVDKYGIIAAGVAKVSFSPEQIFDNAKELIQAVIKLKPAAAKGTYVKSIYISSTMSPGVQIDVKFIDSILSELKACPNFYLTDVSDLNAEKTNQLRRQCFNSGVKMIVVKNALLHKAMQQMEKDYEGLYDVLKGSTALMLCETGNAPAKLIKSFRKTSDRPILKGAFIEECCYIGDDMIDALCNIKSKNDLIADVIALLQSPMKNIISGLQSGGHKLSGILETLSERPE